MFNSIGGRLRQLRGVALDLVSHFVRNSVPGRGIQKLSQVASARDSAESHGLERLSREDRRGRVIVMADRTSSPSERLSRSNGGSVAKAIKRLGNRDKYVNWIETCLGRGGSGRPAGINDARWRDDRAGTSV